MLVTRASTSSSDMEVLQGAGGVQREVQRDVHQPVHEAPRLLQGDQTITIPVQSFKPLQQP